MARESVAPTKLRAQTEKDPDSLQELPSRNGISYAEIKGTPQFILA